ncbi:MAG: hypothetical protein Q8J89_02515 [Caulobacter sp.]|nr:hypothetical protein [Caulobacter sp.]
MDHFKGVRPDQALGAIAVFPPPPHGIADHCAESYTSDRSPPLPHLFRHLCIGLCVALLAAMNLHGVSQVQHAIAHASDWPAVAIAGADSDHHLPGGGHVAHVHLAPDEAPDADIEEDADGPRPVSHHHHAGGDVPAAMPDAGRMLTAALSPTALIWRPGPDPALSSLAGDGPEHPPKRKRTVV